MQKRQITRNQFEETAAWLDNAQSFWGECKILIGNHEEHGATVLIFDGISYVAYVEEPNLLDLTTARSNSNAGSIQHVSARCKTTIPKTGVAAL